MRHHAAAVDARGRLSDMERETTRAAGTGTLSTAAGRMAGWIKRASFPWCIHPGGRLT